MWGVLCISVRYDQEYIRDFAKAWPDLQGDHAGGHLDVVILRLVCLYLWGDLFPESQKEADVLCTLHFCISNSDPTLGLCSLLLLDFSSTPQDKGTRLSFCFSFLKWDKHSLKSYPLPLDASSMASLVPDECQKGRDWPRDGDSELWVISQNILWCTWRTWHIARYKCLINVFYYLITRIMKQSHPVIQLKAILRFCVTYFKYPITRDLEIKL